MPLIEGGDVGLERQARLWAATGDRCWYCGRAGEKTVRTLDHVVPRADGGSSEEGSLVPACRPCNALKARLSVREFRALLWRRRVQQPVFKPAVERWIRANCVMLPVPHLEFYGETLGLSLPGADRLEPGQLMDPEDRVAANWPEAHADLALEANDLVKADRADIASKVAELPVVVVERMNEAPVQMVRLVDVQRMLMGG